MDPQRFFLPLVAHGSLSSPTFWPIVSLKACLTMPRTINDFTLTMLDIFMY